MLEEIKTVLYASDTLIGSRSVFKFAVLEAIKHDAKIVYLHVLSPVNEENLSRSQGYLPLSVHNSHNAQTEKLEFERVLERMKEFFNREVDEKNLKYIPEIRLEFGRADDCIIKVAKDINADLIVMGDRGNNNMSRFFLGSTAHTVIRKSPIPVVIVPIKNKKS